VSVLWLVSGYMNVILELLHPRQYLQRDTFLVITLDL
jgi:hypothetical protein